MLRGAQVQKCLLGAQIIGYEGVDKRIDVLATAIHAGLKATQLKDLDLAYAPPYSSAKDPVNMAGFMIDNIAKGTLKQWHLEDMDKISKDKSAVLLDVRTVDEFSRGHMDGFKNIPVDELRERINEILGIQKFDTEKLREIIKVIRVHGQNEIEIKWNFDDIFSEQR